MSLRKRNNHQNNITNNSNEVNANAEMINADDDHDDHNNDARQKYRRTRISSPLHGQRYFTTYRRLRLLFYALLLALFIVYIISPVVFKYCPFFRRALVFMNYVNVPLFKNLSDPRGSFGLKCTRVFYVNTDDEMTLGAWHIMPKSSDCESENAVLEPSMIEFKDNRPIIFYLHGE